MDSGVPTGHHPQPRYMLFALGYLTIVFGAILLDHRYRIWGDPRKPFVLFGLGYLALVVVAVYVDYRYQLRRARKRRETKQVDKEK